MILQVNGKAREFESEPRCIGDVLMALAVDSTEVVVELNGHIVDRAEIERANVSDGDRLEIVQFVGGG